MLDFRLRSFFIKLELHLVNLEILAEVSMIKKRKSFLVAFRDHMSSKVHQYQTSTQSSENRSSEHTFSKSSQPNSDFWLWGSDLENCDRFICHPSWILKVSRSSSRRITKALFPVIHTSRQTWGQLPPGDVQTRSQNSNPYVLGKKYLHAQ